MLNIINNVKLFQPFIEDCYIELGVREYSKLVHLSPPTASKILKGFEKQNLLKMGQDRKYLLFRANRESNLLKDLSVIYWKHKLSEVINYLDSELFASSIILFGSLSKLESKKDSDIDLAVISKSKKKLNIERFNKKYKREIQLFVFSSLNKINEELRKNILNGVFLTGEIE